MGAHLSGGGTCRPWAAASGSRSPQSKPCGSWDSSLGSGCGTAAGPERTNTREEGGGGGGSTKWLIHNYWRCTWCVLQAVGAQQRERKWLTKIRQLFALQQTGIAPLGCPTPSAGVSKSSNLCLRGMIQVFAMPTPTSKPLIYGCQMSGRTQRASSRIEQRLCLATGSLSAHNRT